MNTRKNGENERMMMTEEKGLEKRKEMAVAEEEGRIRGEEGEV